MKKGEEIAPPFALMEGHRWSPGFSQKGGTKHCPSEIIYASLRSFVVIAQNKNGNGPRLWSSNGYTVIPGAREERSFVSFVKVLDFFVLFLHSCKLHD